MGQIKESRSAFRVAPGRSLGPLGPDPDRVCKFRITPNGERVKG